MRAAFDEHFFLSDDENDDYFNQRINMSKRFAGKAWPVPSEKEMQVSYIV